MPQVTLESLAERVESLGRECETLQRRARTWRRVGALGLAGVVAFVAGGAFQEGGGKAVEAERFVVKGKDGRVRAEFGMVQNKGLNSEYPRLAMFDPQGKMRVELVVGLDGSPSFGLRDADERTRMTIIPLPDGSTQVHFYEKAGWGQLSLGAWPDGSGVKLYGPDGRGGGGSDHGGMMVARDGSTKLNFFAPGPVRDNLGFERVSLGVSAAGKPAIVLTGDNRIPLSISP